MSLRDPEFRESLEGFIATSTLEENPLLPPEKVWVWFYKISIVFSTRLSVEDTSGHHAVSAQMG